MIVCEMKMYDKCECICTMCDVQLLSRYAWQRQFVELRHEWDGGDALTRDLSVSISDCQYKTEIMIAVSGNLRSGARTPVRITVKSQERSANPRSWQIEAENTRQRAREYLCERWFQQVTENARRIYEKSREPRALGKSTRTLMADKAREHSCESDSWKLWECSEGLQEFS